MIDTAAIERIRHLENEHGELSLDAVLKDARKKTSPLHRYFEWDNTKAAQEWRKEQARRLVREVRVQIHETETSVRQVAYVRDPSKDYHDSGYVSTASLRNDKQRARAVLIAELERAEAALARAYDVAEAVGMADEIESLRAHVRGVRTAA